VSEERNKLKAVLRAMAERREHNLEAHATPDELMAFHRGDLSGEEKERLREHLVWCRECLDLLLEAAAWVESDREETSARPEAQVHRAWQAMQARLRHTGHQQQTTDVEQRTTNNEQRTTWLNRLLSAAGRAYAIAASLLMISLALSAWIVSLRQQSQRLAADLAEQNQALTQARQQLEETSRRSGRDEAEIAQLRQSVDELSQPQINVPIEELPSQGMIRRSGGSAVRTILVPSDATFLNLILNVDDPGPYADYALELWNQQGQTIWSERGLRKNPDDNTFTVALPRRLLTAGQYRLRLYGVRAGQQSLIEEYKLRIQYR
jgi:hypothetical protein